MTPRRVLPQVGELNVQRQEDAAFRLRSPCDLDVRPPKEPLFCRCGYIVADVLNGWLQLPGQVFVQLDLQDVVTFQMVSRANSAAYAMAA